MRWIPIATISILSVLVFASSGGAGTPDEQARVPLPLNVAIDQSLRGRLEERVALSTTLQRQFGVIAGAPAVVEVRVSLAPLPAFRRAETTISRYDSGFIRARVVVPPGVDFVELLAHELEHVVEQIERVDLAALARTGGATQDPDGVFETARARDAGRAAASEVEDAMRAVNAQH
jgi:hypothetical protein